MRIFERMFSGTSSKGRNRKTRVRARRSAGRESSIFRIEPLESRLLLSADPLDLIAAAGPPAGAAVNGGVLVNIPTNLTAGPGTTITVPVNIDNAAGLESVDIGNFLSNLPGITYDTNILDAGNASVRPGTVLPQGSLVVPNVNDANGTIFISISLNPSQPITQSSGSLVLIDFQIKAAAPNGTTNIDFRNVSLNEGGLSLTQAPRAGNDPTDGLITIGADSDNDGVFDTQEPGDANFDGIPDSQQANVASLLDLAGANRVTFVSPAGTSLKNVRPMATPAGSPTGVSFPFGFFDFDVQGVAPGGATSVQILLPSTANPNTYWKFGAEPGNTSPNYYEFLFDGATGAQFEDNVDIDPGAGIVLVDRITLRLVDGARGDNDLTANGFIDDPGAAGVRAVPPAFSINDVAVAEGNNGTTVATFTVTKTGTTGLPSTVDVQTANSTAAAGSDYVAVPLTTLLFAPTEFTKTLSVTINGDAVFEANETFFVNLTNPVNATISDNQGIGTITNDDVPPAFSINDVQVVEGNSGTTIATFIVTKTGATELPATVQVQTADGSATAGADYVALPLTTLTFAAADLTRTVSVTLNGDTTFEANETFLVNLSTPTNATISDNQGIGTITNDDAPPAFSINDVQVAEGNSGTTIATFTVTKTGATELPATVQVQTADGSATAGADYVALPLTTLTFAAADLTRIVSVTLNGDTTFEANETFLVNLSTPTNATISDNQGIGTITNDDVPPAFSINDVQVAEGNSGTTIATFIVTKTGATELPASVQVQTANGTAGAGTDYIALSPTTLNFAAGDTTRTVSVTINGDTLVEADETFFVNLTNASNATIADNQGVGTILNDDGVLAFSINDVSLPEGNGPRTDFVFTVTLTGTSESAATVVVQTANGTAIAPGDYTAVGPATLIFEPGATQKNFVVAVSGDATFETNETFFVNLSDATNATIVDGHGQGTIINDDAAPTFAIDDVQIAEGNSGTTTATFTITKTGATELAATVQAQTADGTATAGSDYSALPLTTLTFAAAETTKTISIAVNGDTTFEPNETFFVNLSHPNNATITDGQGMATIINDDAPPNTPPVANNDLATTLLHTPVSINVLANDTDDGTIPPSTVTLSTGPAHGVVQVDTPTGLILYTPGLGFFGTDQFSYSVKDNLGLGSNVATVTITVHHDTSVPLASLVPDPASPRDTALVVMGTNGADKIRIVPQGNDGVVKVLYGGQSLGDFKPTSRILIFGLAGDDDIRVAGGVDLPVIINNVPQDSKGADVILPSVMQSQSAESVSAPLVAAASPLAVAAFTTTNSGFTVRFNHPIDASVVNLYDTETGGLGPADVSLVGQTVGTVRGSLVVQNDLVTFIRTGGPLVPDTYTATLRSAANGFKDQLGNLLDANNDGTPGDNFATSFTVTSSSAVLATLPDFARGPGQVVKVPSAAFGIPITLNNGHGVPWAVLTLQNAPRLLTST